ncbi:heparin lyase I family protein [Candidatus Pelagibacter communis]|uniref:heparin lyase I family protein n=1 Tax=Pelagibacter ubique TaxID=198252 RepID=UPI00094C8D8B|nr:heparin lyase I family protein [Candidatus Pelagibacter ubique]
MKKFLLIIFFIFFGSLHVIADEWKIQNKWKISCGLVDKEALAVNGKPKKSFNKREFKVDSVVFKLDKGEVGKCKTDKKPTGGYKYSGRQEITHRLPTGNTVFETMILTSGAPQYRSHFFQIHDGRSSGKPPSMVQVTKDWAVRNQHSTECFKPKCKQISYDAYLKPGEKKKFKAEIKYDQKAKRISSKYYLNDVLIIQHLDVPIAKKQTDGPYGPNKPYIKIGIYRIGDTGTTTFSYENIVLKNKKGNL